MKLALGFPLSAEEAYKIGLAQWLVPHDELIPQVLKIAEEIASFPPFATQMAKESLSRGLNIPNIDDASWGDVYRFMSLSLTQETKQRHDSWRNSRK